MHDHLVFEGLLDVAKKVRDRLRAEGIAADLLPLPFVSPQVVEGQVPGATRYGRLYVAAGQKLAALGLVQQWRATIEAWSGST